MHDLESRVWSNIIRVPLLWRKDKQPLLVNKTNFVFKVRRDENAYYSPTNPDYKCFHDRTLSRDRLGQNCGVGVVAYSPFGGKC